MVSRKGLLRFGIPKSCNSCAYKHVLTGLCDHLKMKKELNGLVIRVMRHFARTGKQKPRGLVTRLFLGSYYCCYWKSRDKTIAALAYLGDI